MKVWISLRDGLWRKVEYYTSAGKISRTEIMSSLKLNVDIPDGAFGLQFPEGTQIHDETRRAQQKLKTNKEGG